MGYIVGQDRTQSTLFPQALEEYISAENPVRFIDAFVGELDLAALGFTRAVARETGRPGYDPGDLLRLYIYGYLTRVRSSRLLERETQRNVEVMWLLGKLTPDFKTIADFRKDNLQALKAVCREFTLLCKKLELFGGELIGIDGSKFRAVNNRKRNFNPQKLERAIREIDSKIEGYLKELDQADKEEPQIKPLTAEGLKAKINQLQDRRQKYQGLAQELQQRGETQISLTDPDSRSMPVGQTTEVCYNVQTVVDAKHKLIVAHEVTNAVTDQGHLAEMALRAKATLGVEQLEVVADMGYFDGEEVKKCLEAGITPYIAKPTTSANKKRGLYTKEEFTYDQAKDVYRCPQGAELTYRFDTVELGRHIKYYATSSCRGCPAKSQCTTNKGGRRITRWIEEDLLEEMAQRVKDNPQMMKRRQQLCEHPFGTMKRAMNSGYFVMRRLQKVRAEMSLTVLAYNMKRVLNLLGVPQIVAALA